MPHERLYRTEAVVLRRHDFGEADRLLTLYTPDLGKFRALAKGVRKIASRKAGHLELFMRTQLLLARGRDLDITLNEGEFVIIPRGMDHLPIAEEEAHVILLEPKTTLNTGDVRNERTLAQLERI